jgi:hypothetical protein
LVIFIGCSNSKQLSAGSQQPEVIPQEEIYAVKNVNIIPMTTEAAITPQKIFDVHLHGSKDPSLQMLTLQKAGVYKAAISTSWDLQNSYRKIPNANLLYGLMFPCPNGKVPYSFQPCYSMGEDWPSVNWIEQQIVEGKIDYLGEILSQYYGISSSDSLLFPYYGLAQKYNLPVCFLK